MLHASRSRSALVVIVAVVLAGGLVRWLGGRAAPSTNGALIQLVDFTASSAMAAEPSAAASQPADGAVRIEYRGKPGDLYYYVIENDVTDDVAIITQMFRLPSSTTFKDERTIIQSITPVRAAANQPVRPNLPPPLPPAKNENLIQFEWQIDRYKASEVVTDMAEVAFDSLKHTHPPRELSGLASVPDTKIGFQFDGKSGASSGILIQPGAGAHPTDNRKSKTAENGLVTTENMQELLYAMGEQFLPGAPKNVGDQWEIRRVEHEPPFGTITTVVTCKFKSLNQIDGADIATIDLSSVTFFEPGPVKTPPAPPPAPPVAPPVPTTRPVTTAPHYPIAPRPPMPYSPTTRPFPRPTSFPTSRPAIGSQPPKNPGEKLSTSMPATGAPSLGEFDPGPDEVTTLSLANAAQSQAAATSQAAGETNPSGIMPIAQSQPVDHAGSPSIPTSLPVATQPAKPTEEPFRMKNGHFSGSIRFDVTNGRLVELTLRRSAAFSKVMRSDKEEMKIEQGSKSILHIKGSTTPPRQPIIPGGKKPPVEKQQPNNKPTVQQNTPPRTGQNGTSQPAATGMAKPIGAAATQPGATRMSPIQPATPLKQPAVVSKSIAPPVATTQPARPSTTTLPVD